MQVFMHKKAKKRYDRLSDNDLKERLGDAFGLLSDPSSMDIVRMKGEKGTYRARVGKYRILFVIEGQGIYITDFDTRGKIYK